MLLKEEGDSSHVNQSYDQEVAKADKRSMRAALGFLRSSGKITKSVIDGWQLVHVGLACCRELESHVWVNSLKKVNLHPHHRVDFSEWCKRISHFLQGGEGSFKAEAVRDEYALLPAFWHGMEPDEKKLALSILESHSHSFTAACLRELHSKVHVPMADMQHLRVCLELAAKDPSHLERGVPEASASMPSEEVVMARAGLKDVAAGLRTFQLHPTKADGSQLLSGMAKFEHMTQMARRSVSSGKDLIRTSPQARTWTSRSLRRSSAFSTTSPSTTRCTRSCRTRTARAPSRRWQSASSMRSATFVATAASPMTLSA